MLARYFPPAPDELLYSYLCRLAEENGVSGRKFFKSLFRPESGDIIRGDLPYDCRRFFYRFWKLSGMEGYGQEILSFFLSTTTYAFESVFYSQGQQTNYINAAFRSEEYKFQTFDMVPRLRFCRKCQQEDLMDYGYCYYHRSHQLSGVTTCYKHGCLLRECTKRIDYDPLTLSTASVPAVCLLGREQDVRLAVFCHELLKDPVTADRSDVIQWVRNSVRGLGREDYVQCLKDNGVLDAIEHKSRVFEVVFGDNRTPLNRNDLLLLAFECWTREKGASVFRKRVSIKDRSEGRLRAMFSASRSVITGRMHDLFYVRHADCGRQYVITANGILSGFSCPDCVKGNDLMESLVNASGQGEYSLIRGAPNMQDKIRIRHEPCGRVYDVRCIDFITRAHRCLCRKTLSFDDAERLVKEEDGFSLVRFRGPRKRAEIRHEACGRTFSIRFDHFLNCPSCRYCNPTRYSSEDIRKRIRDLVGDEYELVGEYQTSSNPVLYLKHKKCGKTERYAGFFHGKRCSACRNTIFLKDLRAMVQERSGGRCSVSASYGRKVEVLDASTGLKTVVDRQILKQELFRPTRSPLFPGFDPHIVNTVDWDNSIRDKKILESFQKYLFFEDLEKLFPGHDKKYYEALAREIREKYGLTVVAAKIYARPGLTPDAMEIIRLKYMERDGETFGYFSRAPLLSGGNTDIPSRVYIRTNAVKGKTEHKILGVGVRLSPPKIPINSSNARSLQVLDHLLHFSETELIRTYGSILQKGITYRELMPFLSFYPDHVTDKAKRLFG